MVQQMPLAARNAPETLEEFIGQQHIVGRNRLLYRAIRDRLSSVILRPARNGKNHPGSESFLRKHSIDSYS